MTAKFENLLKVKKKMMKTSFFKTLKGVFNILLRKIFKKRFHFSFIIKEYWLRKRPSNK
jgi:hypothetical protein